MNKKTAFVGMLLAACALWTSSILAQGSGSGGGGDTTPKAGGGGSITNKSHVWVADKTNTFNGMVYASNITAYGTIITSTLIAQTFTNTTEVVTNLLAQSAIIGPTNDATAGYAMTVRGLGVAKTGWTALCEIRATNNIVKGYIGYEYGSVDGIVITGADGLLSEASIKVGDNNVSILGKFGVDISSPQGTIALGANQASQNTLHGSNTVTTLLVTNAFLCTADSTFSGNTFHTGVNSGTSFGTNAVLAKVGIFGQAGTLTNSPLLLAVGSSARNEDVVRFQRNFTETNARLDKAGTWFFPKGAFSNAVWTCTAADGTSGWATNAGGGGTSIVVSDGIYASNAVAHLSNSVFLGTVSIPGNSASANYVLTCTNATTGGVQWKAAAAGSSVSNVQLRCHAHAAYGTGSDAKVARFATTDTNTLGTAATYATNAANGSFITIHEAGFYSVSATVASSLSAGSTRCISLNSTSAPYPPSGNTLAYFYNGNVGAVAINANMAWSGPLATGDVIRVIGDTIPADTTECLLNFSQAIKY